MTHGASNPSPLSLDHINPPEFNLTNSYIDCDSPSLRSIRRPLMPLNANINTRVRLKSNRELLVSIRDRASSPADIK